MKNFIIVVLLIVVFWLANEIIVVNEKCKRLQEVIEGRQKELEKAIVNLHDALKELEDE